MSGACVSRGQPLVDAGFVCTPFSHWGATRDVYQRGKGPPVLVLSELPGITPQTLALCERLVRAGYAVTLPQLFGEPGAKVRPRVALRTVARACISQEFTFLARGEPSPITSWLCALARHVQQQTGQGVGVIGMCLTGGFGLAMMVDDSVLAPVLSQPSLPAALVPALGHDLGLDQPALARVKQRCEERDLCVLGLRFSADKMAPRRRFERLRAELGPRFLAFEIDSHLGNRHGIKPWAHSVLTNEFVDEPGHPTREAWDAVLAFLARQLPQNA